MSEHRWMHGTAAERWTDRLGSGRRRRRHGFRGRRLQRGRLYRLGDRRARADRLGIRMRYRPAGQSVLFVVLLRLRRFFGGHGHTAVLLFRLGIGR
jgi:hypothetical protein